MVEAAPKPAEVLDHIMPWNRTKKASSMQVPNYVSNPDTFDSLSNDLLLQRYAIRSQQKFALTREVPSFATAESLESIAAHMRQIEGELINRGLTPTFTPVETSALVVGEIAVGS